MSINNNFLHTEKNELHEHLIKDFNLINATDKTLHIIDNYNVKTLYDQTSVDFYRDSFRETYINQIIFYNQVDLNENDLDEIHNLSNRLDLNFEELISFVSIFRSKSKDNKPIIEELKLLVRRTKYPWAHFKSTVNFMNCFREIGINVKIHPYQAFTKNYIHGRYWINIDPNIKKGCLVDGSLNCYPNALIIAQKMDEENYDIISKILFNIIDEKSNNFIELNLDNLNGIYLKICDYLQNNR